MSTSMQLSPEEASLKAQLMEMMRETSAMAGGDGPKFASASGHAIAEMAFAKNAPPRQPAPNVKFVDGDENSTTTTGTTKDAITQRCGPFIPHEPESLEAAGLNDSEVEGLILKCMLSSGNITGRQLAEQIRLSFKILQRLLAQLKLHRLVGYKSDAGLNDYVYELTDHGTDRARRHAQHCTYFGAAPVSFEVYCEAIRAQTMTAKKPSRADL